MKNENEVLQQVEFNVNNLVNLFSDVELGSNYFNLIHSLLSYQYDENDNLTPDNLLELVHNFGKVKPLLLKMFDEINSFSSLLEVAKLESISEKKIKENISDIQALISQNINAAFMVEFFLSECLKNESSISLENYSGLLDISEKSLDSMQRIKKMLESIYSDIN